MSKFCTPSAVHLFLLRERAGATEVLLQKRAGDVWASGWWDAGAAGHVEKNEPMSKALAREAAEEIGVTFDPKTWLSYICNTHGRWATKRYAMAMRITMAIFL